MSRAAWTSADFAAIRRLRDSDENGNRLSVSEFKALVREQFFMLIIDETSALNAIPDLLPREPNLAGRASRFCVTC